MHLPPLLNSAVEFSFSLILPAIVTYTDFIAIPHILNRQAETGIDALAKKVSYVPMVLARFVDNLEPMAY